MKRSLSSSLYTLEKPGRQDDRAERHDLKSRYGYFFSPKKEGRRKEE